MILSGNCLDVLATLPEASVHCVVTSPPYWSLRDYGVPPTVWGGVASCAHAWSDEQTAEAFSGKRKWQHSQNGRGEVNEQLAEASMPSGSSRRGVTTITRSSEPGVWTHVSQGRFCVTCGAWLGCLGLEPTPELYVEHLVSIFEGVRRVLRDDGTLWLNLGDCYAAAPHGPGASQGSTLQGSTAHQDEAKRAVGAGQRIGCRSSFRRDRAPRGDVAHKAAPGIKPKDLVGVPWMVAFALRAAGWYLRADNIWSKSNPMPESAQDRTTKSHEYVFLLAKSERYFYDAEAIREGTTGTAHTRGTGVNPKAKNSLAPGRTRVGLSNRVKQNASFSRAISGVVGTRNRRSVWTLPTAPFPGAHFATFPPKLVEPCILAGTSAHGCCSICAAPFKRIVKLGEPIAAQKARAGADKSGGYKGKATKAYEASGVQNPGALKARVLEGMRERITVGWKPTCRHTLHSVEPGVVLDPFAGTGTTGLVAARLGRSFIGIELNADYVTMATERSKPIERDRVKKILAADLFCGAGGASTRRGPSRSACTLARRAADAAGRLERRRRDRRARPIRTGA